LTPPSPLFSYLVDTYPKMATVVILLVILEVDQGMLSPPPQDAEYGQLTGPWAVGHHRSFQCHGPPNWDFAVSTTASLALRNVRKL
jgi:hypothetical protein